MLCVPSPPNLVWLFRPYHKTGTVLVQQLIRTLKQHGTAQLTCGNNTAQQDCLANEARRSRRVAFWMTQDESPSELLRMFGRRLRYVQLIRDPVEAVLSNYYYDRDNPWRGERSVWLRKSTEGVEWARKYAPYPQAIPGGVWPDDESSLWLPGTTVHETLQLLPPESGVMLSLRGLSGEIHQAAIQFKAIQQFNHSTHLKSIPILDLISRHGFQAGMTVLLQFLSLPALSLGMCLQALDRLDTSTHHSDHTSTQNFERARMKSFLLQDKYVARVIGDDRQAMRFGALPEIPNASSTRNILR